MGNKRKNRSSIQSNTDLSKIEEPAPTKNIKKSNSYSGSRSSNPFSIVPDNFSDRNDSDNSSDKDQFEELQSISQSNGDVGQRRLSQGKQSSASVVSYSTDFNDGSEIQSEFSKNDQSEVGQSKKLKKKGSKKKEKTLQMYDEQYETTKLPSRDDVNEIIVHLKIASQKSWQVFLGFIQWISVKLLALVVLIIQVVLLIISFIWKIITTVFYHAMRIIFSVFPILNSILLKQHNKKDPFKRSQNNINMKRIINQEREDSFTSLQSNPSIMKKRYTLALDLDETLVYTQPYKQKLKEKVDEQNNPDIVQVIHPSQQSVQFFTLKKRPGLDIFLLEMSKIFNLVIYSSAQKQYVDAIVDKIDTNKLIVKRLYRDQCFKYPGLYIKDIQQVGSIESSIILDNSQEAVQLDFNNSLIIPSFRGDESDQHLYTYSKILQYAAESSKQKNTNISDQLQLIKQDL
ncbi:hypothetical protein ABPG72_000353 [Tetrahymena utriculariae]